MKRHRSNLPHYSIVYSFVFALSLLSASTTFAQGITITPAYFDFGDIIVGAEGRSNTIIPITVHNSTNEAKTLSIVTEFENESTRFAIVNPEIAAIRTAIRDVADAAGWFLQDYGEDPSDLEELAEAGYPIPNQNVQDEWEISFVGSDPIVQIEAVTREEDDNGNQYVVNFHVLDEQQFDDRSNYNIDEITIAADERISLVACILPDSVGEIRGTISLEADDRVYASRTITAEAIIPQFLELSTDAIEFYEVEIYKFQRHRIVVRNTSGSSAWLYWDFSDYDMFTVNSAYIEPERNTIGAIYHAAEMYNQDTGEDPHSVEQLEYLEYVTIPDSMHQRWDFSLVGSDPITQIEMVSTAQYQRGAGHVLLFDVETNMFSGFGHQVDHFLGVGRQETFYVSFYPRSLGRMEETLEIVVDAGRYYFDEQIFEIPLTGNGTLSVPPIDNLTPTSFAITSLYPNPFNSTTTLKYTIDRQSEVNIALFDLSGRELYCNDLGAKQSGEYAHTISADHLPSGLYIIRLTSGRDVRLSKIALVR